MLPAAVQVLGACSGPQSVLDPAGPAAQTAATLWWAMFVGATVVLLLVVSLWLYALRRRPRAWDATWAQALGRRWIVGGGLVLPSLVIAVLLAFGVSLGHRLLPLPADGAAPLRVEVIGHQWWWEIRYPDSGVRAIDELTLPVGRPVDVHLTSSDVIHSFWVPRLGGKVDAIPGRSTVLRLQASVAGTYRGQCAEFCGLHHAHMKLVVHALTPERFASWLDAAER